MDGTVAGLYKLMLRDRVFMYNVQSAIMYAGTDFSLTYIDVLRMWSIV